MTSIENSTPDHFDDEKTDSDWKDLTWMDLTSICYFDRINRFPADLRIKLLTLRSHPSHIGFACQIVMKHDIERMEELTLTLEKIISIDQDTADLQYAQSYFLEAKECLQATDVISACMLYEMCRRLCQRIEDASPPSDMLFKAKELKAYCLTNLGGAYLQINESSKAREHLQTAHDLLVSTGHYDIAARCKKLLASARDDDISYKGIFENPADYSGLQLIVAAHYALWTGSLLKFLEITPYVVKTLDKLSVEERIQLASTLMSRDEHRRSFLTKRLMALIEERPDLTFLQEGRFLWAYFTVQYCFLGLMSNTKLLYLAIRIIESLSLGIKQLSQRAIFRANFFPAFEEALRWALTQDRFLLALRLSDQMKSRSTLDLMLIRQAKPESRQTTIEEEMKFIVSNASEKKDRSKPGEKENQVEPGLKRLISIGKFESHLQTSAGRGLLHPKEESPPFISVNAARRLLNVDSLLLEYCICGDLLHVFAAPSTRFTDRMGSIEHWVTQIGVGQKSLLETACRRMLLTHTRAVKSQKGRALAAKQCEKSGRDLYDILIRGAKERWKSGKSSATLEELVAAHHRLVIIPTGPLCAIPWFGLCSSEGWLWQRHLLSICPSLSFLWIAAYVPRPLARSVSSVLLVGNPINDLPGTEVECKNIARLLGQLGIQYKMLLRQDATVDAVLTYATKYDMLHIACHGNHIRGRPDNSYLTLADGKFYSRDLASLDLEGRAVVLSCCESGAGETSWGDDCFALAHACLIGGARYAMSSLWPVADESTAFLMKAFYSKLLHGQSPQMSLNLAIRELVHNEQFNLPYFWAPFEIFGVPEELDIQTVIKQTVEHLGKMAYLKIPVDILLLDDLLEEERLILGKGL